MTKLIDELVCYCVGYEDAALAAALHIGIASHDYNIADAYWSAATEEQRNALAEWLGISTPRPPERSPVPYNIGDSFKRVMRAAEQFLAGANDDISTEPEDELGDWHGRNA